MFRWTAKRAGIDPVMLYNRLRDVLWLILDQGIFAATNFVINVLFARWLVPSDYGWYVMSFSECLFITMLHYSAIQEPVLVQAASVEPSRRRSYVASLARIHIILLAAVMVLSIIAFFLVRLLFQNSDLAWAIGCGIVGAIALMSLVVGRRLCFIFIAARASAMIGIGYLVACVSTAFLLHYIIPALWWVDIWLVIGGWSVIGSVATFGLAYAMTAGTQPYSMMEILAFGRRYAHWGVASSVTGWLRAEGLFFILARVVGLGAVAEARAVFNLAAPLVQGNLALQTSALVRFSADHASGSKRNICLLLAVYCAGMAILVPIVAVYASDAVRLFYHGLYVTGAWQLPWYCVAMGLLFLDGVVSSVFKARGHLAYGYVSGFIGGVTAIASGLVLIPLQGSLIYAIIISCGAGLMTSLVLRMRSVH